MNYTRHREIIGSKTYGSLESDSVTGLDGRHGGVVEDQLGKGLDGQGRVASGARGDELGGEGVDLVEAQGGVESLRERGPVELAAKIGRVAGLDGQDGSSSCEVGLAHDVGSGTEVGGNTNALEDRGSSKEGLDISVAEIVRASCDGSGTNTCRIGDVSVGAL